MMKLPWNGSMIGCVALLVAGGLADAAGQGRAAAPSFPTSRDPVFWPFSADSPWNTPLAATATYSDRNAPCTVDLTDPSVSTGISALYWSQPIYVAKPEDPWTDMGLDPTNGLPPYGLDPSIHHNNPVAEMRVPADATPALPTYQAEPLTDAHLNIIDETHRFVVEMWRAKRIGSSKIVAFTMVKNDLRGPGLGTGGSRAYGGSALGGLIRRGELGEGIHHALSFCIPRSKQKCCEPVWPATTVDGKAQGTYLGHIPLGQLVALPPQVDLKSLALRPQGYAIAKALQDYGAYDVDSGGGFAIYVEPTAADELGRAEEDLRKIRPLLRCVTNNRADSVGGGAPSALRRAPKAPPFAK